MTGEALPAHEGRCPLDADFVKDPHGSYAALRRTGSVHQAADPDGVPLILVTSYESVRGCAMSPALSVNKRHARSADSHGPSLPPELDAHLLNSDPAVHARLRRLISKAFTPRRTEGLRDAVQVATDQLLDRIAVKRRADIVADLATPLSMTVICDLLGIPVHNRPISAGGPIPCSAWRPEPRSTHARRCGKCTASW